MAPVEGAMSASLYLASSGRIASVWGVPRLMNRATTFSCSISLAAFSAARGGLKLSSSVISLIFSPFTPPWALTLSR